MAPASPDLIPTGSVTLSQGQIVGYILGAGSLGMGILAGILKVLAYRKKGRKEELANEATVVKVTLDANTQFIANLMKQLEEQVDQNRQVMKDRLEEATRYQAESRNLKSENSDLRAQYSTAIYELDGLRAELKRATMALERANNEIAQLRKILQESGIKIFAKELSNGLDPNPR